VQLQVDEGCGHLGAGVPGGDEAVGVPIRHALDPDDHGAVRLAPEGDGRLVRHGDNVRRVDDRESITDMRQRGEVAAHKRVELRRDDRGLPYEFDVMLRGQRSERLKCAGDGGPRGKVTPHGIHGNARQVYASCAVTRCSPA
jgi:hypothetical protein